MNVEEVLLRRVSVPLTVALLLVAGFGCASSPRGMGGSAVAPEGLDLSGNWVFNEEESDDTSQLRQMGQAGPGGEETMPGGAVGGRRPGGEAGMPPGGGRRGGGRAGGRGGMTGGRSMPRASRLDPEKVRQTLRLAMDPKRRFSIEQADSSVRITTAWQEPLEIRADGRSIEREYDWGKVEITARWIGTGLVLDWDIDGGGKVSERYTLSTTTNQLFVVTRLETAGIAREPIELRRVYDPAAQPERLW